MAGEKMRTCCRCNTTGPESGFIRRGHRWVNVCRVCEQRRLRNRKRQIQRERNAETHRKCNVCGVVYPIEQYAKVRTPNGMVKRKTCNSCQSVKSDAANKRRSESHHQRRLKQAPGGPRAKDCALLDDPMMKFAHCKVWK